MTATISIVVNIGDARTEHPVTTVNANEADHVARVASSLLHTAGSPQVQLQNDLELVAAAHRKLARSCLRVIASYLRTTIPGASSATINLTASTIIGVVDADGIEHDFSGDHGPITEALRHLRRTHLTDEEPSTFQLPTTT